MLALISPTDPPKTIRPGSTFVLPTGEKVSPAIAGWACGDYRLAEIQPADPIPEGKRSTGTSLQIIDDIPKYINALEDIPIEDAKAALKARITAKRWEVMTGGINLPSGLHVATAIDDQNRITSVVANAELAGLTDADEVDFKAVGGWVRVSIGQIKQMAGAIGQLVQACYSAERAHHEAVGAIATIQGVLDYDYTTGWPST